MTQVYVDEWMIIIDGGWVQSILHLFSCMSEI